MSLLPNETRLHRCKAWRASRRKVVHVLAGRGLFQEIFGEEMCVISGEGEVPVNFPFDHYLGLAADAASVAGPARLEDVNCGAVDAVMRVFTPEKIPV